MAESDQGSLFPLTGETMGRPGDESTRVPMNVDKEVRDSLRNLLYEPEMRGVGYSEFIARAVIAAWGEIEASRG